MAIRPNVRKMSEHAKKHAGELYLAKVIYKKIIDVNILLIRLKTDMIFSAGQKIKLYSNDGISQSYFIASHQFFNDYIELHIDLDSGYDFSIWLQKKVYINDCIEISCISPMSEAKLDHDKILLCCDKQGLPALYSMLTDCIINSANKKIEVVISVENKKDIYILKKFIQYEKILSNITIHYIIQSQLMTDIFIFFKNKYQTLTQYNMYFFGDNQFVHSMFKLSLAKGANHNDIISSAI